MIARCTAIAQWLIFMLACFCLHDAAALFALAGVYAQGQATSWGDRR